MTTCSGGPLMVALLISIGSLPVPAQENYEIQVYGSETVAPKHTMVELHSNYTFSGAKDLGYVYGTEHAWHETLEVTHGLNAWSETAFYIFTSYNPSHGYQFVGSHIRPRARVPEEWHWPVGVSLSTEFGYQRARFSEDTWSLEIRPIVDKQLGKWYLAFNPTVDRSLHGPGVREGFGFSPNFKTSYKLTKRLDAGLEYYGSLGPITGFSPLRDQQQQILPSIDLDLGPNWEFNFGIGVGVTHSTDHLLMKMIVGRRFNFGRNKGT